MTVLSGFLFMTRLPGKLVLPHWWSNRKCDCKVNYLGFDTRNKFLGVLIALQKILIVTRRLELCSVYCHHF